MQDKITASTPAFLKGSVYPAAATSADAIVALKEEGLLRTEGKGRLQVFCTADLARVERLAGRMLPVDDCDFSLIDLKKN